MSKKILKNLYCTFCTIDFFTQKIYIDAREIGSRRTDLFCPFCGKKQIKVNKENWILDNY